MVLYYCAVHQKKDHAKAFEFHYLLTKSNHQRVRKQNSNSSIMVEHAESHLDDEQLPLVVATQLRPNGYQNQDWVCPQCTLFNPTNLAFCDACTSPQPRFSLEANANGVEPEIHVEPVPEGNGTDASENKFDYQLYSDNPKNVNQNIGEEGEKPEIKMVEDLREFSLAKKMRRRRRRRLRMVAGGTGGLIIGAIIFCGPIGVILAAVGGAVATRAIIKRRESKKDQRVAQANLAAAVLD
jgi:hypothetical protein